MRRVAILLTCHNRKEQTVACLKALDATFHRSGVATYHAFVTDDGSTDGTSEAVRSLGIPVTILQGSGDLFWNRGMVRAWKAADEDAAGFDGYLLLNDDTLLAEHALTTLIATLEALATPGVVVGAVRDPNTGEATYGGVVRMSRWHPGRTRRLDPRPEAQPADTFNANCVYVPAAVARSVGTLDPLFHHSMGDFDYGFRARNAGFPIVVAPGTVGVCASNSARGTWRDRSMPMRRRLRHLMSPKGVPYAEWREFLRRHGAPVPTLLAAAPLLSVLVSSVFAGVRRPTDEAVTIR